MRELFVISSITFQEANSVLANHCLIAWYTSQINFAIENYFNTIDLQKKKNIVANRILLAVHQKGKQNMNNSERYLSPVNSL